MKKHIFSAILVLCMTVSDTGCNSVSDTVDTTSQNPAVAPKDDSNVEQAESQADQQVELNVTKQVPETVDGDTVTNYVDFTVKSVSVEQEKIVSLDQSELSRFFGPDAVQEDGTLDNDYVFVSLEITMKSDADVDALNLASCVLYYSSATEDDMMLSELSYQSDPVDPDDLHSSGVTSLNAGEEKDMTIGFLVSNDIMSADSISLYAAFADYGSDAIVNPMFKISDGLEATS